MVIDTRKYRKNNLPAIEVLLKDKNEEERFRHIPIISISYHLPIIVVCYFVGELYGFSPQLLNQIQTLKEFYQISDVIT